MDDTAVGCAGLVITLVGIAAMLTHIVVCIKTASYLLLIGGAIFFPIGVIHGIMVWFGWA